MFRKPMRLEKWIAFDGAAALDIAEAMPEADEAAAVPEEADDVEVLSLREAGDDIALDLTVDDRDITGSITMPGAVDLTDDDVVIYDDMYLPFVGDDDVQFDAELKNTSGDFSAAEEFYFDLSHPDGGEFTFLDLDEVMESGKLTDAFLDAYDAQDGDVLAFLNGSEIVIGMVDERGGEMRFDINDRADFSSSADGIRFHLRNIAGTITDDVAITAILQSLAFKPNDAGVTEIGNYDLTVYHDDRGDTGDGSALFNGDDSVYETKDPVVTSEDPEPPPVDPPPVDPPPVDPPPVDPPPVDPPPVDPPPVDPPPVDPPPVDPPPVDPPPVDPPPVDPPPVDPPPVDPVIPPPPPVDPGPGDGGGDTPGSDTPGGDTPGSDAGDSGVGDSGGGDSAADAAADFAYIHHDDEGDEFEEESAAADAPQSADGAVQVEVEQVESADGEMETAAAAIAMELTRDFELMLTSVQEERTILLGSLSRLQEEYLRRGAEEMNPLREVLATLFDSGNREKDAVNRVIAAMNRQMEAYRNISPELRDGMLAESLRELVDSADRRTGETGAISRALDAVVRLLARDGAAPAAGEVRSVFDATHSEAIARYQARAELADPMGKELAASKR